MFGIGGDPFLFDDSPLAMFFGYEGGQEHFAALMEHQQAQRLMQQAHAAQVGGNPRLAHTLMVQAHQAAGMAQADQFAADVDFGMEAGLDFASGDTLGGVMALLSCGNCYSTCTCGLGGF